MVRRYYLDISTLQVFINNLCTIPSVKIPTNGIQGFVRHIFSAIHEIRPPHILYVGIWGNQL